MRAARLIATLLLSVVAIGASPPPHPIGVTIEVGRTSFDLLDSVAIAVVAHNAATSVQPLTFLGPQEDVVEVLAPGNAVIWSSKPPPPNGITYPGHLRAFTTGPTTVIVRDWNELTAGGWSPLPGKYTIRASLNAQGNPSAPPVTVSFAAPLPPSALGALKPAQIVTIGGSLDATRGTIADAVSSAKLSRRILTAPAGVPVVVRGYATDLRDGTRTFTVTRWAPLGPPQLSTPSPTSSPSGKSELKSR